jgi:hypothetical protein
LRSPFLHWDWGSPKVIPRLEALHQGPGIDQRGSVQIPSHIFSSDSVFGLGFLDLKQRPHVHVSFRRPLGSRNVPQTVCGKVEAGLTVRESANHSRAPPDLPHDALQRIVGPHLVPVDVGKGVKGECLVNTISRASCPAGKHSPWITLWKQINRGRPEGEDALEGL